MTTRRNQIVQYAGLRQRTLTVRHAAISTARSVLQFNTLPPRKPTLLVGCAGNVEELKATLPSDAFEQFLSDPFTTYISTKPMTFQYRPAPDCQTIYRTTFSGLTYTCPNCLINLYNLPKHNLRWYELRYVQTHRCRGRWEVPEMEGRAQRQDGLVCKVPDQKFV